MMERKTLSGSAGKNGRQWRMMIAWGGIDDQLHSGSQLVFLSSPLVFKSIDNASPGDLRYVSFELYLRVPV